MTGFADQAAAAKARRDRFNQLRNSVTPEQAANVGKVARQNPGLSPGAAYGVGKSGVQPGSKALKEINRRALAKDLKERRENSGGLRGLISAGYKAAKVVGGALTPDFVGEGLKGAGGAAKGVSRGAFIAATSVGQYSQGLGRSIHGDGFQVSDLYQAAEQTDLFQASREIQETGGYGGLLTGKTDADYGSGFFAGGNVRARTVAAEKEASNGRRIGGKTYTAGRFIANGVGLEPGNLAYNTVSGLADAVVALGTDPTSYTGAPTKALQARRLFAGDASKGFDAEAVAKGVDKSLAEAKAVRFGNDSELVARDMGALPGIRKTVNSDRVLEWLTAKKEGQQLVAYLSKTTDFGELYDRTKGKIDPQTLLRLSEREMTGDEVIEILGPQLGRTARTDEKFRLDAMGRAEVGGGLGTVATAKFQRRVRDARIFGTVPERVLPRNDMNEALKNASAFMRNAGVSGAARSDILRRYAQADGGNGMLDVTKDMMTLGATRAMDEFGIDKETANKLFRIYENTSSDRRKFWQEQVVVNGEKFWRNRGYNITDEVTTHSDGSTTTRAVPHLASQFLDNNIPLPDPRAIRAEMSRYRNVLANPGIKVPKMALEIITDNIFKPGVLLRPAYVARNQIDEQFRPAGVGLNSMMSHPVQYLQWLMTDQKGVGKMLATATGGAFKSRGATFGPDGRYFDEIGQSIRVAKGAYDDALRAGDEGEIEQTKAAYERAKQARQSITPFTDGVSEFERSQTGGLGNWRNRSYAQVNGDELYQRMDSDYARAAGEGLHRIFNDPIARRIAAGEDIDQIKADFWRGPLQGFRGNLAKIDERMAYLGDEIGAEQYIDDTVDFVRTFVGDSNELRAAAATGRINGVPLTTGDTLEVTQKALAELDALKQIPGFQGPDAVVGSSLIKGGSEEGNGYTRAVDWAFYQLADRPTRYLSKSPVFRQRYYKRMENLIGFMDDKAAADLLKGAEVANLRPKDLARLQSKRRSGGTMRFDEADLVAKTDALEFTERLFYDLHHRSQFFDVLRLLFPFGEAFMDSAKKYSELTAKNPVLPYRLGQIIQGARDADLNGDGEGFFHHDEEWGEEVYTMPLSKSLLGLAGLEGANQFRSPVANLNILGTSVIPGFGPAIQIAAGAILPDEPDFNAVQKLISPYGERNLEGGALESFLPSWFNKWRTAFGEEMRSPAQQRAFVNGTKDWMGYLASTGKYDITDPADAKRLMDDAKEKNQATFFFRGLAQAFSPSPPSPEMIARDKDGKIQTQFRIAERYREIEAEQREQGTPESTMRLFIEEFGEGVVLAAVPNTKTAEGRSPLPPNKKALEFYQDNKEAAGRFPTVFGLFAPDDPDNFDQTTYARGIESGDRVVITPQEALKRANQNVARMIYNNAQDVALGARDPETGERASKPTREQTEAFALLKDTLAEDFPGYSENFSNDIPGAIEDLKRASRDPQLSATPAGQGLAIWLQARDAAEKGAQARFGVSWKTAEKSREIRVTMRALAEELNADFEGFENIYSRVLEREMVRD